MGLEGYLQSARRINDRFWAIQLVLYKTDWALEFIKSTDRHRATIHSLGSDRNVSFKKIFLMFFLFLRERDTHTESKAGSRLRAVSREPSLGLKLPNREINLSWSWTLNRPSHPGTPDCNVFNAECFKLAGIVPWHTPVLTLKLKKA